MAKFNPIQYVDDDGLEIMDVKKWAEFKYKIVGKYCDIFTKGMKNQWNLVYLDLFSGPGYSRKKESDQIMKNCALIAMSLPTKFDYYILNDFSKKSADALKVRAEKIPGINVNIFNEDANLVADKMVDSIPKFKNEKGTLIFSFIDPFSLNLNFDTVKYLGRNQADVLVLHALQMDARRNHKLYLNKPERIGKFTGNPNWQDEYAKYQDTPTEFMKFVSEEFDRSMKKLGYKVAPNKERIKNGNGHGIYYLCFYSKHVRGLDFFSKIQKVAGNDQYELF